MFSLGIFYFNARVFQTEEISQKVLVGGRQPILGGRGGGGNGTDSLLVSAQNTII